MARTKQRPRASVSSKYIKRVRYDDSDEDDDNDDYDYQNYQNDNLLNEAIEEEKKEQEANEAASAKALASEDYLGPPRKPLNAFYFFKVDQFDATRAAHPTLTMMEVIDVIGQKWGDLDESKRAEYQEKYEKHRDLYQESLKPRVWKPPVIQKKEPQIASTTIATNPEIVKSVAKEEKPAPPKRPLTAFFHYVQEVRPGLKEANPELKITELTKIIANNWKEMNEEGKQIYEAKATEEKQKYEQDLKDYIEKYGPIEKKKRMSRKHSSDEEDGSDNEEEKEEAKPSAKSSLKKSKK